MKEKLKLGDIVIAKFLGFSFKSKVIEVIDEDTYKLKTTQVTILPSVKWKNKYELDKNGKLKSPWYIEKLNQNKDE